MNRPKSTRKMKLVKPFGNVPARIDPNHHALFRQPSRYYEQKRDPRHYSPGERLAAVFASLTK